MYKEILENIIPKERIYENEPMSKHISFKVGGPAEYLIKIENIEELQQILKLVKEEQIPFTVIGNGSNILVKDSGIRGIVAKIEIKKFDKIEIFDDIIVTVGSGNKLGELGRILAKYEISGFEFATGIPGTIGGAIRMNAGAHGSEMKDIVKTVTYLDEQGQIHTIENEQAEFEYRKSLFSKNKYIIIEATIALKKGKKEDILNKLDEYMNYRKEKQPIEYPSAGSTFKRGTDFITAKLIDDCGLKGYQIGGAQISEKHAGFIINKDNATAEDIIKLIKYTEEQIYDKFGKKIEKEIEIIGE